MSDLLQLVPLHLIVSQIPNTYKNKPHKGDIERVEAKTADERSGEGWGEEKCRKINRMHSMHNAVEVFAPMTLIAVKMHVAFPCAVLFYNFFQNFILICI